MNEKKQYKTLLKSIIIFTMLINISYADTVNKNVSLQLSWFNQFQFAGYYIAKEKGFYKDEDLNVNIKPFQFGIDIPEGVNSGKIDFGIGREVLILEKIKKKEIVALYALFQASPLILLTTKESNIDTLDKFEEKNIMTTLNDATEVSLKAMVSSQKVDFKSLNLIKHSHDINDLINNKVDIMSGYLSKSPYHLQKMGIKYNSFSPKDYGFDMYSDFLYTNNQNIIDNLDVVLKFKKASLKGWDYAYKNIDETVNLILQKYNTQNLTKEELIFEANELKKLSYYQTKNLGEINISKLQRIFDLYNIMGLTNKNIDINNFVYVDNTFFSFIQSVYAVLDQYIHMPYIYFFIGLFIILLLIIIKKHFSLRKMTQELIKKNKKLKELSITDSLTDIYNRRYFESVTQEHLSLSRRQKTDMSILILDIDNFKDINDTYGHQIGDKVLISLANLMKKYKRSSDIIARYGGEEFIILLPNTSLDGVKIYSEKLRKEIENYSVLMNNVNVQITVSMGVTVFHNKDDLDSALKRADDGLYDAKKNGRNQIQIK